MGHRMPTSLTTDTLTATFLPRMLRLASLSLVIASQAVAQAPPPQGEFPDGPPPNGPPGFGPGGPGFGGPGGPAREILNDFDKDDNGRLEGAERDAARAELKKSPQGGRGRGGMRGPGGNAAPKVPGPKVAPKDVVSYTDAPLFATDVVRTVFIDFDVPNWEEELELFHNTDADVPARMTVDGKVIEGVGVHFRGASSYMMVPRGSKRSFSIAVDHTDPKARLYGQNTLNFLNANGDASFMSSVLYAHLAAPHIPAPKANFVEVVVNGESWGVFVNVEQFNKVFLREHWPEFGADGARWQVLGSPRATGGLDYRGEDLAAYRQRYEIKTKDREEDWKALVLLTKTLSETPIDQLEEALKPMLDIDGALWFLALDVASANSDGYWTRASDYSLYRDPKGVFHIVPHDMNEAFKASHGGPGGGRPGGFGPPDGFGPPGGEGAPREGRPGRGMRPRPADSAEGAPPPPNAQMEPNARGAHGAVRGAVRGAAMQQDAPSPRNEPPAAPRGQRAGQIGERGGVGGMGGGGGAMTELDPLTGMSDATKPLRSRLLQVPALRERYLTYVRTLAQEMSWENMGPFVARLRETIAPRIAKDTRKAFTTEAFERDTSPEASGSLRQFLEKRSKYLSAYRASTPNTDAGTNAGTRPAKDQPEPPSSAPSGTAKPSNEEHAS
jgi:hypothetical protein